MQKCYPTLLNCLETFQTVRILLQLCKNVQTFRKLFQLSANFPACPDNFQTVWKIFNCTEFSKLSQNFPDCPKTLQTIPKLSRLSNNFPECQKKFRTVQKLSRLSGIFPHLCYVLTCFGANFVDTRKTFRLAMPTRRRGFSASVSTFGLQILRSYSYFCTI